MMVVKTFGRHVVCMTRQHGFLEAKTIDIEDAVKEVTEGTLDDPCLLLDELVEKYLESPKSTE